jgi:hypothetical protein
MVGFRCDALRRPLPQKRSSCDEEENGRGLRAFEHSSEHYAPSHRIATEFRKKKNNAGGDEEDAGEIAVLAAMRQPENERHGKGKKAERRIGLHRMNRNIQGCAAPTLGKRIGVGDGPWYARPGAKSGSGKQSSDLLESEAESRRSGQSVCRHAHGEIMNPRVDGRNRKREDNASAGEQRMMDHCQAQHPEGMAAQHGPVCDYKQKARPNQRSEEHEDAEIPDFVGICAKPPRHAQSKHESQQQSNRGCCAVGRNNQRTDVKENGMHLTKDKGSECERECDAAVLR